MPRALFEGYPDTHFRAATSEPPRKAGIAWMNASSTGWMPGFGGISLINIGTGPSNARTITDHVAVLQAAPHGGGLHVIGRLVPAFRQTVEHVVGAVVDVDAAMMHGALEVIGHALFGTDLSAAATAPTTGTTTTTG